MRMPEKGWRRGFVDRYRCPAPGSSPGLKMPATTHITKLLKAEQETVQSSPSSEIRLALFAEREVTLGKVLGPEDHGLSRLLPQQECLKRVVLRQVQERLGHEYEDFPRVRIVYEIKSGRFIVYADRRLRQELTIASIAKKFGFGQDRSGHRIPCRLRH